MKPIVFVAIVLSGILIFDGQVYNGRLTHGATSILTQIARSTGLR